MVNIGQVQLLGISEILRSNELTLWPSNVSLILSFYMQSQLNRLEIQKDSATIYQHWLGWINPSSFHLFLCHALSSFSLPSSPSFSLWHWSLGFTLTIGIKLVQCSAEEKAQGLVYIWKALASGGTVGPWVLLSKWHSSRWHILSWGNKHRVQAKVLLFRQTILIPVTLFTSCLVTRCLLPTDKSRTLNSWMLLIICRMKETIIRQNDDMIISQALHC